MDQTPNDKFKEGVSVHEIETFGKKHRFELFICVLFVLATFFGSVVYHAAWSLVLAGIGGVAGIWMPHKLHKIATGAFNGIKKQKPATRWVIVGVSFLLAIFVPMLVFLAVGLTSAHTFYMTAMKNDDQQPPQQ